MTCLAMCDCDCTKLQCLDAASATVYVWSRRPLQCIRENEHTAESLTVSASHLTSRGRYLRARRLRLMLSGLRGVTMFIFERDALSGVQLSN